MKISQDIKSRIRKAALAGGDLNAINVCQRLLKVSFWEAKDIVREVCYE